ncbi:PRD domain-containing protein [Pediococcus pentosaceus]
MIDKHCHRLKVNLDCDQQIAFICFAIALIGEKIHNKVEAVPFTCVMIAHGSGVATNIRNIVNSLCSNFVFEAFDMPIDTGIDEISQEIQIYLKQLDVSSNNGVVLLFDMGSPQQLFAKINQATGSNLLVISNLTTSIALDVALRVLQKEQFEDLATHAETYNEAINIQFYEGLSQKNNIIISCMSGVGISEEIKKTILKSLDNSLEIITMEYSKLKNLLKYEDDTFFKNTMFVITTVDFPEKFSLPIINIYDILDGNGTNNFRSLLLKANFSSIEISSTIQNLIRFFSVEGVKHRLHILNPDVVITDVEQVVQNYEAFFDIHFSEKIKLNLYMHIALMLERMVLSGTNGEKLNQSLSNLTDNQQEFIKISKHIFEPIAMKYNLNVSLDEILLINEILAL